MMSLYAMFVAHWLGDFVLQHRWLAENKSKNIVALLLHVSIYTLVLCLAMAQFFPLEAILIFGLVNAATHGSIDSITSKITNYFWKKQWIACFWWTIGFDQMLHTCILLLTYRTFLEKV